MATAEKTSEQLHKENKDLLTLCANRADKIKELEKDVTEARELAQKFKDDLEQASPIDLSLRPGDHIVIGGGSQPSYLLEPVTFKPDGQPGAFQFHFENSPEIFKYVERMTFKDDNGWPLGLAGRAVEVVKRALDPFTLVNGVAPNRIQQVGNVVKGLGPFDADAEMWITVEIRKPGAVTSQAVGE